MAGTVFALLFVAQSSCILNDDFLRVSDTFTCQNNGDCGEPGFELARDCHSGTYAPALRSASAASASLPAALRRRP